MAEKIFDDPKEQAKYEKICLEEKELALQVHEYREKNKLQYFTLEKLNRPNPPQAELLEAWEEPRYKVFTFTGGNRSGKTTLGVIIGESVMFGKWLWNDKKLHFTHNRPRKVRYIGQDWHNQIEKVVIPKILEWWPEARKVKTKGNGIITPAYFEDLKTGSSLEIMSNLQLSDVHEGWDGDLIIYDEPPKRDIRVANARGLIDREGRELFCATLLKEAWIHHDVINAVLKDGKPDPTIFNVSTDIYANVGYGITIEGVKEYIKKLDEDEIDARIHGIPSYMSGLVYPTFKRKTHLVERFKVPLDWMIDIAIDVHPRERQAVLFMATDPKNERYLVNEIWDHGDGTWIAENIIRCVNQNDYRVNRVIIDPLAKGDKNNPNTTFDKIALVLMRYGYLLETATKDLRSGILEVKKHLIGPNNKPSLFMFDDLIRVRFEIEGYMYDEKTQKPKDENDHMMENLYRTLLLNTQYVEPEEEQYETVGDSGNENRDEITGY
jgi:hypothetical protein